MFLYNVTYTPSPQRPFHLVLCVVVNPFGNLCANMQYPSRNRPHIRVGDISQLLAAPSPRFMAANTRYRSCVRRRKLPDLLRISIYNTYYFDDLLYIHRPFCGILYDEQHPNETRTNMAGYLCSREYPLLSECGEHSVVLRIVIIIISYKHYNQLVIYDKMVNLIFIFPIITFWHSLSYEITKYKPAEFANNSISFIHCMLYLIHYQYEYNLDYMLHVSIGYYMYDLLYELITIRCSTSSLSMTENVLHSSLIVHHLIGIFIIIETLTSDYKLIFLSGYNLMELSNVMLYISNYLHNEYNNTTICIVSDFVYFLWYAYFRVIRLSGLIYENIDPFFEISVISRLLIIMLYLMGFAWSCNLFVKTFRSIA